MDGDQRRRYSSPIAATVNGVRTILCLTRAGLVALDPATGKIRFQHPWRSRNNASVNAALPVVAGDLIFLSASYNTGAVVLEVKGDKATQLWASDDALSNHYATSVHKDGALFGFHGRQEYGQSLRCIDMKTGKVHWSADDFGAGTATLAGGLLLIVRENGEAILAPATTKAFQPASRMQLLPGVIRSYPAIADSRLYVRNEHHLAAYEVPGL
jgi:outer membrane protein assembly factor BamB